MYILVIILVVLLLEATNLISFLNLDACVHQTHVTIYCHGHPQTQLSFITFSTKRIPVLYIFGRESVDPEKCMSAFKELFSDQLSHILVMYDVRYSYVIGEVNIFFLVIISLR